MEYKKKHAMALDLGKGTVDLIAQVIAKHDMAVIETLAEQQEQYAPLKKACSDAFKLLDVYLKANDTEGFGCACLPDKLCGPCVESSRQKPLWLAYNALRTVLVSMDKKLVN